MTMASDAQQKIEAYLTRLCARLRGLNRDDVREIVEELRSHILDKAAAGGEVTPAGVDAALAALGSPEELASQYATDALLARAEVSRSPLRVLDSLFRWASLSVAGFLVLLSSIVGYFLGVVFMLCAVLKPFHPRTAGLWVFPDATTYLRMGFGGAPLVGRDVLGWWIVPVGLGVGCGLVTLTTRFALWCAREYRKSHLLPQG
jgi:HAAS